MGCVSNRCAWWGSLVSLSNRLEDKAVNSRKDKYLAGKARHIGGGGMIPEVFTTA